MVSAMSEGSAIKIADAVLLEEIDTALTGAIARRRFPKPLADAMTYAATGPGKRIRPLLCVRCCMAVNGGVWSAHPVVTAAVAVELVHAFSLVHDDLPALDNDDLRRGRPTVHRAFDEAIAVLAGDALQGLAWELIAGLGSRWSPALSWELSTALNDMIAGQVYDTVAGADNQNSSDEEKLKNTHRLKTGALLRAACRMGARCGGAEEPEPEHWTLKDRGNPWWGPDVDSAALTAITEYADALGLMFQAVDDLLDVTSDTDTMGKATQKDADAGKLTYPGVYGIDGTRREIARLHTAAREALDPFGPAADPLREMADRLATRTR